MNANTFEDYWMTGLGISLPISIMAYLLYLIGVVAQTHPREVAVILAVAVSVVTLPACIGYCFVRVMRWYDNYANR